MKLTQKLTIQNQNTIPLFNYPKSAEKKSNIIKHSFLYLNMFQIKTIIYSFHNY